MNVEKKIAICFSIYILCEMDHHYKRPHYWNIVIFLLLLYRRTIEIQLAKLIDVYEFLFYLEKT